MTVREVDLVRLTLGLFLSWESLRWRGLGEVSH